LNEQTKFCSPRVQVLSYKVRYWLLLEQEINSRLSGFGNAANGEALNQHSVIINVIN